MRAYRIQFSFLLAAAIGLAAAPAAAQRAGAQSDAMRQFETVLVNWEAGKYIDALEGARRILDSPEGASMLQGIALVTGEFFHVDELTTDGRNVALGPTGRYATYSTSGRGAMTRIVALDGDRRTVVELDGSGLSFSPDEDEVVYVESNSIRRVKLPSGEQSTHAPEGLEIEAAVFGPDGNIYVTARGAGAHREIYGLQRRSDGSLADPRLLTRGEGDKFSPMPSGPTGLLVYQVRAAAPAAEQAASGGERQGRAGRQGRRGGGRRGGRGGGGPSAIAVRNFQSDETSSFPGESPLLSADGSTLVFTRSEQGTTSYWVMKLGDDAEPRKIHETEGRAQSLAVSPSGARIAFQMMPEHDWEIFAVSTADGSVAQVTDEIQHDINPQFITDERLMALKGESRHRRSYLYDIDSGASMELFHNNTVRTIAPQYEWVASADGTKIGFVAERDGDTVSPERGVYVMDLRRQVTVDEVRARIDRNLAAERDLRARGEAMYAPIADEVRGAVGDVSGEQLHKYQADLFEFGSKYITQPGNARAIEYLEAAYRSFGYEPELQWFDARGTRTANVLATLPGTKHPELVYIISSHFDSVARGPGADDNTSGTSVLLESARVLKNRPQAATIVFASFTGEEAGLLGSRHWVRQAVAADLKVVGALNNDMIGWANSARTDNTIRYSNPGIRDVTHAGAFLFSGLITYDALYYKSTDAAAYYDAYGDIVGGIGSYPVLGNPHYHQPTDRLDTIGQPLVRETTKTNIATLMLLASSPSRLKGLEVAGREGADVKIAWTAAPESDVVRYEVTYGPESDPTANAMTVTEPTATLAGAPAGTRVAVRAVNDRGLTGWDWARVAIEN